MFHMKLPECIAKGSRLTLEVWRLESCSPIVVLTTATVGNRSQAFVLRSLSLTVGRRSQNVTKSSVGGRFQRK